MANSRVLYIKHKRHYDAHIALQRWLDMLHQVAQDHGSFVVSVADRDNKDATCAPVKLQPVAVCTSDAE